MKGTKAQVKKTKKALSKGKEKQDKAWSHYKTRKEQIQKSKRIGSMKKQSMIQKELEKARGTVSRNWNVYRGQKFSYYNKSRFTGLTFEKKQKSKSTLQEFYKVRKTDNLDNIVGTIFSQHTVRYILVMLEIRLPEGQVQCISDVFTKPSYDAVLERGETLLEATIEKLSFLQKYEGYEILSTHIRVIYAGSKTN